MSLSALEAEKYLNGRLNFLRFIFFVFIPIGWFAGCETAKPPAARPPGRSLPEICRENNLLWEWDGVAQSVTVKVSDVPVRCLIESPVVIMGEEKAELSFPLYLAQGTVIVPADFKERIVDYILKKSGAGIDYFLPRVKEVVIDAGHGGKDPGASGRSGLKEKDVVLDIALRLKTLLAQAGLKVIMTRETDEFISLGGRTETASRSRADLFVSIHANSSPARSASGMEVYCSRDVDLEREIEEQRQMNQRRFFESLAMKESDPVLEKILVDLMYNYKQTESTRLASHVVDTTAAFLEAKNRGAKEEGYFVLRNTLTAAVLVEVGFLSNAHEERLLGTEEYRQKVAEGLARSILNYARF